MVPPPLSTPLPNLADRAHDAPEHIPRVYGHEDSAPTEALLEPCLRGIPTNAAELRSIHACEADPLCVVVRVRVARPNLLDPHVEGVPVEYLHDLPCDYIHLGTPSLTGNCPAMVFCTSAPVHWSR